MEASAVVVVALVFALVVPFEKLFPRHRQPIRRAAVGTDIGYALAGALFNVAGLIVAIPLAVISLTWVPGLLLRPFVAQLPAPMLPLVGFVLFDLAIYWSHRCHHEVPFLWRFHAIHHSTERLDWVSGFRAHPLDSTLIAPAVFFLLAAGFDLEVAGGLAIVQILIGIFLHANVRWRLRPLRALVATPEFHHWHHANHPEAVNINYSGFLPIWDVLFNTFHMPADRRPIRYGVSEFVPTGMIGQLRHPLRGMPPVRRLVWAGLRHPVCSTRAMVRLARAHIVAPIRRIEVRRTRTRL